MTQRHNKIDITTTDKFPAGLRILAVDDDPTCLMILAQQLRKCSYEVTMCTRATEALSILRENKDSFDLVISDVYMPDMDGFKLLECVGLEMDLPVIMTSSHGETSVVMKGVTHGACDYLIKPVRLEELRNIWQHVLRKKKNSEPKDVEASASVEDNERQRRGSDDGEYASSVNDGAEGNWKLSKRRKDDDENEHDYDDPSTLKKQRVVWSVELHQQFVNAVNHLGIDKAVPKKILELMNVQGLTRENVASHLQKYRLYLRRLSGVQAPPTPGHISQHHHALASMQQQQQQQQQQQGSLLRATPHGEASPVILSMPHPVGGFYRAHPPPPLMNIPSVRGIDLVDSQISPTTPVDEVPVAGLSVLQHQLANVGGIGRGNGNSNASSLILSHHQHQHQQQQSQTQQVTGNGTGFPPGLVGENRYSNGAATSFARTVVDGSCGGGTKVNHAFVSDSGSAFPVMAALDSTFAPAKDLTGNFNGTSTNNGRSFGSKLPGLSLHQHLHHHHHHLQPSLPARFAVDSGGSGGAEVAPSAVSADTEESNFRIKLESGVSNEADDLFSIILKQQQQLQNQHQVSAFADSDFLM